MPRPKASLSRRKPKVLTSYRCYDGSAVTLTGFGRTLQFGANDAVLESPDKFPVGQPLLLEFLLDNDQVAHARGHVTRIGKSRGLYRVKVLFDQVPAKTRRLLTRQVAG